ncbi:Segregation and condensation protein A [uncultured Clostridium sp.]|uniref:segregation/condensation protein A n=1 Tax=uncultured Clostridium sp. TaxID=59620 RepID=UPI000822C1D9|nr:segregation/condensation protein A [uncultured Clostridium sp.]SCJ53682.1 Segregation and condensation protein A [uncultured Clostridium sp.]
MELLKIKVADFEGPFDLLLHLIKKNKMDIYNVEIYKITNQYLESLNEMKEMDLEITSEFVVIAATLIEIKSKKLLPKVKVEDEENEEDIEKRLMEKLIEYKRFKGVSQFFKERYTSSGEIYSKKPEVIEEIENPDEKVVESFEDIFKNITLLDLYNIYNRILENYREKQNVTNVVQKRIYVDKYKIEDKMNILVKRFENDEVVEFSSIMMESECKMETVVTFLAVLELIKIRVIKVYQEDNFGNILMKRRRENE